MNEYAIYCLDRGVSLVAAEWIAARDDGEALRIAAMIRPGTCREVWKGHKFVGRIEVDPGE